MDVSRFHEVVRSLQSPVLPQRQAAEQQLNALMDASAQNFMYLIAVASDSSSFPDSSRQLCCILLRQFVVKKYYELDVSYLKQIVDFTVNAIFSDSSNLVRKSCIVILAKYCSISRRDEYHSILSLLVDQLAEGKEQFYNLVCKTICEIAVECKSAKNLVLVQTFYTHTRRIFLSCPRTEVGLIRYIIRYNRMCIESLANSKMAEEIDDSQYPLIQSYIFDWVQILVDWSQKLSDLNTLVASEAGVYIELFMTMTIVIDNFYEDVTPELIQSTISCAWQILVALKDFYLQKYVLTAHDDSDLGGYNSDGDRTDVDVVVAQTFELLCVGVHANLIESDLDILFGEGWEALLEAVLSLAQMTTNMVEEYSESGNELITNEEEDGMEFSMRLNGAELLGNLQKPEYIINFAQKELGALQPFLQDLNYSQQVRVEAILFVLESVAPDIIKLVNGKSTGYTAAAVAGVIVPFFQVILTHPTYHFWLKARAISAFVSLKFIFGVDQTISIIGLLQGFLSNPAPVAFHLQIAKSLSSLFEPCKKNYRPFREELIEKCSSELVISCLGGVLTITEQCDENTVNIPLKVVSTVVKATWKLIDSTSSMKICECVISQLARFRSDPWIVESAESILSAFVGSPSGVGLLILQLYYLPYLNSLAAEEDVRSDVWELTAKVFQSCFEVDVPTNLQAESNALNNVALSMFLSLLDSCPRSVIVREILLCINAILASCLVNGEYANVISQEISSKVFSSGLAIISKVLTACNSSSADSIEERGLVDCITPAMGLFSLLILLYKDAIDNDTLMNLLGQALSVFKATQREFVKNVILMSLVHLVSRGSGMIFSCLYSLQTVSGFENIFMELLQYWCAIHSTLEPNTSKYSLRVSTVGIMEAAKTMGNSENNSGFVSHLVGLAFSPRLINSSLEDTFAVVDDDDENGRLDSECDDDDDDFSIDESGNVFAAAEDYFGEGYDDDDDDVGGHFSLTNIPDCMLFSKPSRDPLVASTSISEYLASSLQALGLNASGKFYVHILLLLLLLFIFNLTIFLIYMFSLSLSLLGSVPMWYDALDKDTKKKIKTLFS